LSQNWEACKTASFVVINLTVPSHLTNLAQTDRVRFTIDVYSVRDAAATQTPENAGSGDSAVGYP
jgi:hypothetical protein